VSVFPTPAPAPTQGQRTFDGSELVPLTARDRDWYPICCDKALREKPSPCVCAFITVCPDHGRRHNGTHD
jgi:hypothetical protein